MPIYEYKCEACKAIFSHLSGVSMHSGEPRCPRCGNADKLTKLISRVMRIRSEEEMLENLIDFTSRLGDLEDPKTMVKFAKMMGRELGSEFGEDIGDELEAAVEEELKGKGEGSQSSEVEE